MFGIGKKINEFTSDITKIPEEYLYEGYLTIKKYCSKSNQSINEYVNNPKNQEHLISLIHETLPMPVKMVLNKDKFGTLIKNNYSYIINKIEYFENK